MEKQSSSLLGWLTAGIITLLLIAIAVTTSTYVGDSGKHTYLLFDKLAWVPFLIAATAALAAVLIRRPGDKIIGDKVLRHDGVARLTHWSAAAGCMILLYSGVTLGFLFVPRFAEDAQEVAMMFNLHFVGALLFVFGCILWISNQFVDSKRRKTHLPDDSIPTEIRHSIVHYLHLAGLTKEHVEAPKYHHSGRLAGLVIIITAAAMIISGFIKVFARIIDIAPTIMEAANLIHGAATLVFLLLIPVHAFLGGLAPWAWYTLRGMVTGYITKDEAKKHHKIWYRELTRKEDK